MRVRSWPGCERRVPHLVCAGRDPAQAQALFDQLFRMTEAPGDLRRCRATLTHAREGFELIKGMHGQSLDVLGKRDLLRVAVMHAAGHGMVGGDHPSPARARSAIRRRPPAVTRKRSSSPA